MSLEAARLRRHVKTTNYAHRMNSLTAEIIALEDELREREEKPAPLNVGARRHAENLAILRERLAHLKCKRFALLGFFPRHGD